jgi:hypothetical protein
MAALVTTPLAGGAGAGAGAGVSPPPATLHIVFHGNCIDGWLSAYIASGGVRELAARGFPYPSIDSIQLWAISPNQAWTWSRVPVRGCHVLLLDVTLPEDHLKGWEAAALSVYCIDHHASSLPQWAGREGRGLQTAEHCATWLTWSLVYPEKPVPEWVALSERIDLWTDVTAEDRALREVLYPIAVLAVKGLYHEALARTDAFLNAYEDPAKRALQVEQGQKEVVKKSLALKATLEKQPTHLLTVEMEHCSKWSLPSSWLGLKVFLLNGTGVGVDSTEAAQAIFELYPEVSVFISYRHKCYIDWKRIEHRSIVYSARARDESPIDLTTGGVFAGHPHAAGGARPLEAGVAFVIEAF